MTKLVKQSRKLSYGIFALSLYEQRIMFRIILEGQSLLKGKYVYTCHKLAKSLEDCPDVKMEIKCKDLLSDGCCRYEDIYNAAISFAQKQIGFWDDEKKNYQYSSVIFNVIVGGGSIRFQVSRFFWFWFLDFSRGFSYYDIEKAMSLPSPLYMRLYMFAVSIKDKLTISIDNLKAWFCVSEKYKLTADFIRKVIDPCKKYLDEKNFPSFEFEKIFEGKKIVALRFSSTRKDEPALKEPKWKLFPEMQFNRICRYLMVCSQFSEQELKPHVALITAIAEHPQGLQKIEEITHRANKQLKGKGWIIAALRAEFKVQ